jgi:hypothetical protein
MKTPGRFLSAFQVLAGVYSLVSLWPSTLARGWSSIAALVALSALSIVAGALMWRGGSWGWRMTIVNQAAQLLGIHLPRASYTVIHCASITVLFNVAPKASFAASQITQGVTASFLHSVCDILVGKGLEGMPAYAFSLNLLAAGILVHVIVGRKWANQRPEQALHGARRAQHGS